jgi:hypothetical protein
LFPRSLSEYVGENELCIFIRDLVVEELDLSEVYEGYSEIEGRPQFNPTIDKAGFSRVEPCLHSKQSFKVGCFSARIVRTNNIFNSFLQYFFLIPLQFYTLTPRSGAEVCRRANFLEPAPRVFGVP